MTVNEWKAVGRVFTCCHSVDNGDLETHRSSVSTRHARCLLMTANEYSSASRTSLE